MPAYGNFVLDKGYNSASVLTKYRAVKMTANAEEVTAITADTDVVIGVSQFDITTAELAKNKGASVRIDGITEWEISAAVTRGQEVTIAADGRCLPATTGKRVWGIALEGAGTAGNRIPVRFVPSGRIV